MRTAESLRLVLIALLMDESNNNWEELRHTKATKVPVCNVYFDMTGSSSHRFILCYTAPPLYRHCIPV